MLPVKVKVLEQFIWSNPAFDVGTGKTVMVIEEVAVQPAAFVTVTVYVVNAVGLAVG